METQNQIKARELAIKYCKDIDSSGNECYNIGCEIACNEAMQWKDEEHAREKQEWIKKVTDFISQHFYISTSNHVISKKDYYSLTELIRDINQAMEE